jgi:hypothetical protein
MKMRITLRWRHEHENYAQVENEHANCAQLKTWTCQLRSGGDMHMLNTLRCRHAYGNTLRGDIKMPITVRWRHENANYAEVETWTWKLRSGGHMKTIIALRWRHENVNSAQVETCKRQLRSGGDIKMSITLNVETWKCYFRSRGDMNMLITLSWKHENANFAQVET